MNFNIYFKENEVYYKKELNADSTNDVNFFMKLKIQVELQLQNIRDDILSLLEEGDSKSLINPRTNSVAKQKIIDELVEFRKTNQIALEQIKAITSSQDIIVCENCGGWMRKIPVGVAYNKIGGHIVIKEHELKKKINYIYGCDNCPLAIDEEIYLQKIRRESI